MTRSTLRPGGPWPLVGHPVVAIPVFIVAFFVLNNFLPRFTFAHGWPVMVAGPLSALLAALATFLTIRMVLQGQRVPRDLDPRRVGGLLGGILMGAVLCGVVFLILWATGLRTVDGLDPRHPLLVPTFCFGITAGFAEEIAFRGFLFCGLESLTGTWCATILSGLAFGLLHLTNPGATLSGALAIGLEAGIGLALLYRLTGSLWWVVGAHGAWNVVQGPVLGSAISGATIDGDGIVQSFATGPAWLSGGDFGLEASPVSILVWGLLTVWMIQRMRVSGRVVPAPRALRTLTRRGATSPARQPELPLG